MRYDGWMAASAPVRVEKAWSDAAREAAAAARHAQANGAPSMAAQHELHAYGWDHQGGGEYTHSDPGQKGHKIKIEMKPTPQFGNRPHAAWTHEYPDGKKAEGRGKDSLASHLMYHNQRAGIGTTRGGYTMPGRS